MAGVFVHHVDSVRTLYDMARSAGEEDAGKTGGDEAVLRWLRGAVATVAAPAPPQQVTAPVVASYTDVQFDFAPLNDISDYHPPIRTGASKPDLDNNLWILPNTSSQSRAGELVYDVVNNSGQPFFRVRLPTGRSIAGFGHDGVVYLMSRDTAGWHLERTALATISQSAK